MTNKSGNKGEWSEIYAFIKLLKDGKIYAANENLNRISDDMYYSIIKILREEIQGEKYDYYTGEKIRIYHNGIFVQEFEIQYFLEQSKFLYDEMFAHKKGNIQSQALETFNNFLNSVFVTKIKAGSLERLIL